MADTEVDRWNAFVASHPFGQALATMCAKKWWQKTGWSLQCIALFENESIVGGVAIRTDKIPYLPWTLARVVTILLTNDDIVTKTKVLLDAAAQFACSQKALQIEVGFGILNGLEIDGINYTGQVQQGLRESGYVACDKRLGTYLVRIDLDDEALLSSFVKKCRQNVRKALKRGVTVSELRSPESISIFGKFHQEMISRKGLRNLHRITKETYEGLRPLHDRGYVRLFAAYYEGQIYNMLLVDALGVPTCWMSATTPHAFEKGVPPTGQLLHYAVMQWFRARGSQYFDFGGSPGPTPAKGHPNYTVWRFKYDFRGTYVSTIAFYLFWPSVKGKLLTSAGRLLRMPI